MCSEEGPAHCPRERAAVTGRGSGPLQPAEVSVKEGTGLSFHSEGSGGPSSGLETPAGNALLSVGARAPVEDAELVVVLGWTSRRLL